MLDNSAQSIRQSLDNLGAKDAYIQELQAAMAHKDSLNMPQLDQFFKLLERK